MRRKTQYTVSKQHGSAGHYNNVSMLCRLERSCLAIRTDALYVLQRNEAHESTSWIRVDLCSPLVPLTEYEHYERTKEMTVRIYEQMRFKMASMSTLNLSLKPFMYVTP